MYFVTLIFSTHSRIFPAKRRVNLADAPIFGYNADRMRIQTQSEAKEQMKIAGVIAEYNPFHLGHAYHLRETRARTGCDYVVACMTGSFTQRGEAACASKWARTRAALSCGADAVFELPALFAVRTADAFARGGVAILAGVGCDVLSFGCETDDLAIISRLAELRANEPECLSAAIRDGLAAGRSHARARGEALAEMLSLPTESLNAPNLILASEYLRAMREQASGMQPVAIERRGDYRSDALSGLASASAIRSAVRRGDPRAADHLPPEAQFQLRGAGEMHEMDDLLLFRLREMGAGGIAALPDAGEGLDARVYAAALRSGSRAELIERVKCKRYTYARISRLCAHALLGLTAQLTQRHPLPEYARLLGLRADAAPLMREIKARASLPLAPDAAMLHGNEIFDLECRATDLRALLCGQREERCAGQEFTQKFVRVP